MITSLSQMALPGIPWGVAATALVGGRPTCCSFPKEETNNWWTRRKSFKSRATPDPIQVLKRNAKVHLWMAISNHVPRNRLVRVDRSVGRTFTQLSIFLRVSHIINRYIVYLPTIYSFINSFIFLLKSFMFQLLAIGLVFLFFCSLLEIRFKTVQYLVFHITHLYLQTWHAFAVTSGGVSAEKAGLNAAPTWAWNCSRIKCPGNSGSGTLANRMTTSYKEKGKSGPLKSDRSGVGCTNKW